MKPTKLFLASCLLLLTACSCSKDDDNTGGSEPKEEKGYATGKVVDTQGNPIAGAKILLENTVYYASYIKGSTDKNGTYKIKVEPGSWKALASFAKEYNGQTYRFDLHPDNTDSFNETGTVRNFVWKMEGHDPWNGLSFYGGRIHVDSETNDDQEYLDLKNVELTLTPDGSLIDGSEGKTLKMNVNDHYWVDYYEIKDVPIGRYKVTAVLKEGDIPLKVQDRYADGDFVSELQLNFTPEEYGLAGCSASIVIGY